MTPFTETLTDSDGDECSFIRHDQPDATSGVYVQTSADGEVISAGPFTPEALHAALGAVAPAGSDTRTRSLRNDRHYWQARAEKAEHDLIALQDEVNELWPYRKRAEKAEKERDGARGALRAQIKAMADRERAEERRTLTADDIESVLHDILPLSTEHLGADDIADIASDLYTALTGPTRPEGAEAVSSVLGALREDDGEWMTYASDEDLDGLADALAERGVRVTGAGS